jgi:hypothetical protein
MPILYTITMQERKKVKNYLGLLFPQMAGIIYFAVIFVQSLDRMPD